MYSRNFAVSQLASARPNRLSNRSCKIPMIYDNAIVEGQVCDSAFSRPIFQD